VSWVLEELSVFHELTCSGRDSPETTLSYADAQGCSVRGFFGATDHVVTRLVLTDELNNGIAAVQRFLWRQGADLRTQVVDLVQGPENRSADRRMGPSLETVDVFGAGIHH
jgi:hypothetical protein